MALKKLATKICRADRSHHLDKNLMLKDPSTLAPGSDLALEGSCDPA